MARNDPLQGDDVVLRPEDHQDPKTAKEKIEAALFAMARDLLVVAHRIVSVAITTETEEVPTLAVALPGDGIRRLYYNPKLIEAWDIPGVTFGLTHEAMHLVRAHLRTGVLGDETWTLVKEVLVNDRTCRLLGIKEPPTLPDGEKLVSPRGVYRSFKKAVPTSSATYEDFVASETDCYRYLSQMPKPPKPKVAVCIHADPNGDPSGDSGSGGGNSDASGATDGNEAGAPNGHIDPEEAEKVVREVVGGLVRRALAGDESARKAVLEIHDADPGFPMWGDYPIGALADKTVKGKKVSYWERFLRNALASRLVSGMRPAVHRKMLGASELYHRAGSELPLFPVGREPRRNVAVAFDTSGSVGQAVVNRCAELVGELPDTDAHWASFDTQVYEFAPGEELRGRGGTNFEPLIGWVDGLEPDSGEVDAVIVVTDGHAPPIDPPQRDRWIWLIVQNGATWPEEHAMTCIRVDADFA